MVENENEPPKKERKKRVGGPRGPYKKKNKEKPERVIGKRGRRKTIDPIYFKESADKINKLEELFAKEKDSLSPRARQKIRNQISAQRSRVNMKSKEKSLIEKILDFDSKHQLLMPKLLEVLEPWQLGELTCLLDKPHGRPEP